MKTTNKLLAGVIVGIMVIIMIILTPKNVSDFTNSPKDNYSSYHRVKNCGIFSLYQQSYAGGKEWRSHSIGFLTMKINVK